MRDPFIRLAGEVGLGVRTYSEAHEHGVLATPTILDGPSATWLSEFGRDRFAWLADAFDRDVGLRVPLRGTEGFATRIVDWTNIWREHHYRDDALDDDWPGIWGDDSTSQSFR